MKEPLVSIITPLYNCENYIREAIESVLNQTYSNWEMIIIDDCSTDRSSEIVKTYIEKECRIKYKKNIKNMGPAISRNNGIRISKGQYISFLDSDDFWDLNKLYSQIKFMETHNILMSHTDYFFVNSKSEIIKKVNTSKEINYKKLLKGNQFKTMSMILNRDIINNKQFPDIKHEDFGFFLDVLKNDKKSIKSKESIAMCRIGEKSLSSNKIKSAIWTWNIYRKYEKIGLIKSSYYFINYIINGLLKYKERK